VAVDADALAEGAEAAAFAVLEEDADPVDAEEFQRQCARLLK